MDIKEEQRNMGNKESVITTKGQIEHRVNVKQRDVKHGKLNRTENLFFGQQLETFLCSLHNTVTAAAPI